MRFLPSNRSLFAHFVCFVVHNIFRRSVRLLSLLLLPSVISIASQAATTNSIPSFALGTGDDTTKAALLQTFAPRIWMARGERFGAASVEWAMPYMTRRFRPEAHAYCLETLERMRRPSSKLGFFSGCQSNAVAYAFWTEKPGGYIDLSYWQYCPYNLGKKVLGIEFGNHVGDWEHITVRLERFQTNGATFVQPIQVAFPFHRYCKTYPWTTVPTVGSTHVIAYSAKGSHGMWLEPGRHRYEKILFLSLADECSEGTAWDTWQHLQSFEYFPAAHTGRSLGAQPWPGYFSSDYTSPTSGGIRSWGNPARGKILKWHRLESGPRGPEAHRPLSDDPVLN
jgi:hypothetical protein